MFWQRQGPVEVLDSPESAGDGKRHGSMCACSLTQEALRNDTSGQALAPGDAQSSEGPTPAHNRRVGCPRWF